MILHLRMESLHALEALRKKGYLESLREMKREVEKFEIVRGRGGEKAHGKGKKKKREREFSRVNFSRE
mgnify:CR=1 FL=1